MRVILFLEGTVLLAYTLHNLSLDLGRHILLPNLRFCEWTKKNYLKRCCGRTLEVKEDVADNNHDGLTVYRKTQGNWDVEF